MTITETNLAGQSLVASQSAFTTASVAPAAYQLIFAGVWGLANGTGDSIPTCSGLGLTWVQVKSLQVVTGVNTRRHTLFRAMSLTAPTPGPITFTFPVQQTAAVWTVTEYAGVDTSDPNGANAVGQSPTATGVGSLQSVAMGAFQDGNNATFGFVSTSSGPGMITQGSGLSVLHQVSPTISEWAPSNVSPVTSTTTNSITWGMIGVEIIAAPPVAVGSSAEGTNLVTNNEQELIAWRS